MLRNNGTKVIHSARFLKSVTKLPQSVKKKIQKKDIIFRKNPFDKQLNTHKLHGRFNEYWAYSIDYQYRVIFVFKDDRTIIYYDIGSHQIYKI